MVLIAADLGRIAATSSSYPKAILLSQILSALGRSFSRRDNMTSMLKRIGGALKDAIVQMFGLQAVFGSGTGEVKKAAIMNLLKNITGIGELALGRDIVDEAEFVAGLDQAAEGVLRALDATYFWQKIFGPSKAA